MSISVRAGALKKLLDQRPFEPLRLVLHIVRIEPISGHKSKPGRKIEAN